MRIEEYLKSLTKVLAIGAAFALIPLFASFASLQPPWPPAIGYVSAALVLLASLLVWEFARARVRSRRRLMLLSTALTLLGLFAYLILYSSFIENIPGSSERVVRGYECNHDARLVYGDRCPDLPRDALRDAEWESLALWTRSSVTTARVALTVAWLVFMSGLIAAVGSIVAGRKL